MNFNMGSIAGALTAVSIIAGGGFAVNDFMRSTDSRFATLENKLSSTASGAGQDRSSTLLAAKLEQLEARVEQILQELSTAARKTSGTKGDFDAAFFALESRIVKVEDKLVAVQAAASSGQSLDTLKINKRIASLEQQLAIVTKARQTPIAGAASVAIGHRPKVDTKFVAKVRGLEIRLVRCSGTMKTECELQVINNTKEEISFGIDVGNKDNYVLNQSSEKFWIDRFECLNETYSCTVPAGVQVPARVSFKNEASEYFQVFQIAPHRPESARFVWNGVQLVD